MEVFSARARRFDDRRSPGAGLFLETGDGRRGPNSMNAEPKLLKRALRRRTIARVLAIDPAERRRQEAELFDRFPTLPGLAQARTVLLYVSAFPEEFDTVPYLNSIIRRGRRVACPRVDRVEHRLRLFHVEDLDRDFAAGALGIPEPILSRPELAPEEIDWALIPGVAFDSNAFRLGRGAGHYDRLLPKFRPEIDRWALAFEPQRVDSLPIEPHDQPLTGVVYPAGSFQTSLIRPRSGGI